MWRRNFVTLRCVFAFQWLAQSGQVFTAAWWSATVTAAARGRGGPAVIHHIRLPTTIRDNLSPVAPEGEPEGEPEGFWWLAPGAAPEIRRFCQPAKGWTAKKILK